MISPEQMGAPGAAPQGGPPPELMAALMGGAPPGGPEAPPQAPPPEEAPEMTASEHLDQAIENIQAAVTAEPDNADSAKIAACLKTLYDIKAHRDKESDQVFGSAPALRAIRRGGQY